MNPTEILFIAGAAAAALLVLYFALARAEPGSWMVAALLCAGFTGFTGVTIWAEGPIGFFANHTTNLWGVQVWYDLVISVVIGLFLVLPRGRAVGMQPLPWIILTGLTASIGLLAMVARMLWLEQNKAPKS